MSRAIALAALSMVVAAAPLAAQGAEPDAQASFETGVRELRAERFDEAVQAFQRAYDLDPRAETACNLALTFDRWEGHKEDAIDAYLRCAQDDESGRYRDHALARASTLRSQRRPAAAEELPTEVPEPPPPEVEAPEPPAPEVEAPVAPGSAVEPPSPAPPPPPRSRTLLIVGGITAVVGLGGVAGGAVSAAKGNARVDELRVAYPDGIITDPADVGTLDRAEALRSQAIVLYVAGGVVAAAGVAMMAIDLARGPQRRPRPPGRRHSVARRRLRQPAPRPALTDPASFGCLARRSRARVLTSFGRRAQVGCRLPEVVVIRSSRILILVGTLSALALGCGDDGRRSGMDRPGDDSPGDDTTGLDMGPGARDFGPQPEADGCNKMDILFVVDDSGSMGEEQSNLAANFPRFVEVLDAYRTEGGNPLDYRLGVTTTGKDFTTVINIVLPGLPPQTMTLMENGPNGELQQSCGMTRKWIEASDPNVGTTFSCVAEVGTGGSSTEMPLLMTEMALTARVADGSNAGFLREDALLAVVMLTDEDDCSREGNMAEISIDASNPAGAADECDDSLTMPVSRFLGVLDGVKGDRGRWAGAIIAGETDCSSAFGDAVAATRLQRFASEAGDNVVFSSICEGDLSGALDRAVDTFEAACLSFPPLR